MKGIHRKAKHLPSWAVCICRSSTFTSDTVASWSRANWKRQRAQRHSREKTDHWRWCCTVSRDAACCHGYGEAATSPFLPYLSHKPVSLLCSRKYWPFSFLAFLGVSSCHLFPCVKLSNYSSLYTVSYSVNSNPGIQLCPFSLSNMLEYRFYFCLHLYYIT